jgi:hypothetical protein
MVITFTMGTCQGDPLGKALFALVHFRSLCFTVNHFPFCPFPFIANDIHIIGFLQLYHLHMNTFGPNFLLHVYISNLRIV